MGNKAPAPARPPKPRKSQLFNERSLIKGEAPNPPPVKPSKPKKEEPPPPAVATDRTSKSIAKSLNPLGQKAKAKEIAASKDQPPSTGGGAFITIRCAVQETDKDGQLYYAYKIEVTLKGGAKKTINHRYSEFAEFHKEWDSEYPGVSVTLHKATGQSEEDIARRCVELQTYLREVSKVSALLYNLGKFLGGLDEQELKTAAKMQSAGNDAVSIQSVRSHSNATPAAANLPKVKLVEREGSSGAQFEAVKDTSSSSATRTVKFNDEPKKPVVAAAAATTTKHEPVKKEEPKKPVIAAAAATTTKHEPVKKEEPNKPELVKKEETKPAAATTGLSVKERMAAFQKQKS